MMRATYHLLANSQNAKTCQIVFRSCSKVPVEAKTRFTHIRRGNYSILNSAHLEFFKSILGNSRVLSNFSDVEPYNTDFGNQIKGTSKVVLKPKTTEEVSYLLKYCYDNDLAVCPQGGNTGLVYGSVPLYDEVIISTQLMNKIIDLDDFSGSLTCQSGCILETLDKYLEKHDLMMPLDLGAKGTCHIGGNLSTNAGGLRLFRYGNLHGSVLGLEVVLANGQIIDLMSTMKKDNTGYHLKNLFIGAEGTLGLITKVAIQCPPLPKSINVAFIGVDSFDNVLKVFKEARLNLGEILSACELIDSVSMDVTLKLLNVHKPPTTESNFYILIETRSSLGSDTLEKVNDFVGTMLERGICSDGYVTDEPTKLRNIWDIRENIARALFKFGYLYKYDFSLPHKNFYKLVEIMRERLEGSSVVLVSGFGHLGDGNLHLNICSKEYDQKAKDLIEPFVFEAVHQLKGSISAEHGIGLQKSKYLHLAKSQSSIDLMKKVKQLLDPKGIINPYKVLPQ